MGRERAWGCLGHDGVVDDRVEGLVGGVSRWKAVAVQVPGVAGLRLGRLMAPKRDLKQFRQACREVGLSASERYAASEALHAEKQSSGERGHVEYEDLVAWLREWKATNG